MTIDILIQEDFGEILLESGTGSILLESSSDPSILVTIGATIGQQELKRNYPIIEGLTAKTQKQEGTEMYLIPEEKSLIDENNNKRKGLR